MNKKKKENGYCTLVRFRRRAKNSNENLIGQDSKTSLIRKKGKGKKKKNLAICLFIIGDAFLIPASQRVFRTRIEYPLPYDMNGEPSDFGLSLKQIGMSARLSVGYKIVKVNGKKLPRIFGGTVGKPFFSLPKSKIASSQWKANSIVYSLHVGGQNIETDGYLLPAGIFSR